MATFYASRKCYNDKNSCMVSKEMIFARIMWKVLDINLFVCQVKISLRIMASG